MSVIKFNRDKKFDIQLEASLAHERAFGKLMEAGKIVKIELKSETWQWEQTGNICIEYRQNGQPSGIATTEADIWVHELRRDDGTIVYLLFPIDRLKSLARAAYRAGRHRKGGDGGRFEVLLLKLSDILK